FLASFLAITDVGMSLFWTLALLVVCRSLGKESFNSSSYEISQNFPYYSLGLILLFGALFKWPIFLFWLLVVAWFILRQRLPFFDLLGGIGLSLLGLLPSLIWNFQHDFPTFRHVFSTIYLKETVDTGATMLAKGNFLEFFGAQSLLLSPIL